MLDGDWPLGLHQIRRARATATATRHHLVWHVVDEPEHLAV